MSSGIYALYWEEPCLVYIGYSHNLDTRYRQHRNACTSNRHTNIRVQGAFNTYGMFDFIVLEKCGVSKLKELEVLWTEEFDSLNSLNIIEAGSSGGHGTNHSRSKYTKLEILQVFRLLIYSKLSLKEISDIVGVQSSVVSDICNKRTHLWLQNKYPKLYNKMLINKSNRFSEQRGKHGRVVSPEGIVHNISNITEFCNKLDGVTISGISKLLLGTVKTHKGWKLYVG